VTELLGGQEQNRTGDTRILSALKINNLLIFFDAAICGTVWEN